MKRFWIAGLPAESHLKDFRIRDRVYAEGTKLRDDASPFMQLLLEEHEHIEFKWPINRDHVSMPVYKGDNPNSWVVPTERNMSTVLLPQRPDILFVLQNVPSDELLIEGPDPNKRRLFRRIRATDDPLACRMSGYGSELLFEGCLFASADHDSPRSFDLMQLGVDSDASEMEVVAILNPMVIEVMLEGNELSVAARQESNGNGGAREGWESGQVNLERTLSGILNACAHSGGWMSVEPELEAGDAPRIRLLRKAQEQFESRPVEELSRIESLTWGVKGEGLRRKWMPFFCLDQLKGTFFVCESEGDDEKSDSGKIRWYKNYNGKPDRANEEWFAKYWTRHWVGSHHNEDLKRRVFELPPDEAQPFVRRSRASSTGLFIGRDEFDTQLWPSCVYFLEKLVDAPAAYDRDFLKFLLSALKEEDDPRWEGCHQAFVDFRVQKDGRVEVLSDQIGFIEMVSRWLLMPRSRVFVEPPPPNEVPRGDSAEEFESALSTRVLDLRNSVYFGGRKFAEFMHGGLWKRGDGKAWKVPYKDGWWTSWYRGLFLERSDKRFFFSSDRGFRVGESRVGLATIGRFGEGYQQSSYTLF